MNTWRMLCKAIIIIIKHFFKHFLKTILTMGLQYRKGKITLNFREGKPEMYKLMQLTYPQVTFEQLVKECSTACGVNPSQTKAVIDALISRLVLYMEIGHGVRMGDFGSFKPTFTCKAVKTLDKSTLETVKVKKIQFRPGKAFRDMLDDLSIEAASEALDVKE